MAETESDTRYWLCCGSKKLLTHNSEYCLAMDHGNVRFGTRAEHESWQKKFYSGNVNMKITQEKITFQPITIALNTREEAEAFFNIVDKLDAYINNICTLGRNNFSELELELLIQLSNAITNNEIII